MLCTKISASATTICIPINVQEIASLREHMVTGSLDQSQGSTQTSGATKKIKILVCTPGSFGHRLPATLLEKKALRLTQWQESKSANVF